MSPYKLIIFDCDGVLVDSEPLSASVAAEMLAEYGLHMETEEILERFNGRKVAKWVGEVESVLKKTVANDFIPEFRRRSAERFRSDLVPVPGIREVLETLTTPYCLASSGPMSKITLTLTLTDLWGFFEGRIFSGYEIKAWKPDPDLFLHAANAHGVSPEDCAVIEDSQAGIQAGVAAGMTVFHYNPKAPAAPRQLNGVISFSSMGQLLPLLKRDDFLLRRS